ncbi:hypothetical protein ACERNI_04520 [Camelimonas sp. ID_303_24]
MPVQTAASQPVKDSAPLAAATTANGNPGDGNPGNGSSGAGNSGAGNSDAGKTTGPGTPASGAPGAGAAVTQSTAATSAIARSAPTPVASPSDRVGATAAQPDRPAAGTATTTAAAAAGAGPTPAAAATTSAYQPRQPKSDWRPDGAATPTKPSALRPLLLGAAGGAFAALLVVAIAGTGSRTGGPPAPAASDGKIATAMEELEKERAAATARSSAVETVEKAAAGLSARLDALEQKAGASTVLPDAVENRLKTLEQKIAGLDAAQAGRPQTAANGREDAAVAGLERRIAGLEQRLAANGGGRSQIDPSVSSAMPAERAPRQEAPLRQEPAQQAYAPNDEPQDGLRPPGLIPEPAQPPRPTGPVRGWVLHNVYGGVAVLEGRSAGVVEVRRGQSVPGLGRIAGIERRGQRWVVTTDRGVISAPAY